MNKVASQNQPPANSLRTRNPLWFLLAFVVVAGTVIYSALMPDSGSRQGSARSYCRSNLRQLVLALDLYHEKYGSYPPAYVSDKNGRPLYSWRVLILPYIDERPLYDLFHLDEPWDSAHNLPLSKLTLEVFRCASDEDKHDPALTNYLAIVGPNAAWTGEKPVSKKDISDPLSKTIHLVEVVNAGILWAEPRDLYVNQIPAAINPKHGLGFSSHHEDCAQVGFCDGSIKALHDELAPETLRQLIDRNDGAPTGEVGE